MTRLVLLSLVALPLFAHAAVVPSVSDRVAVSVATAPAATRTWKGGTKTGSDCLASTAANWAEGAAPEAGDDILFDSTATSDCKCDLDIVLGNWTQTSDFARKVTIATVYDPSGFDCLEISGNVDLQGGTWTHLANSGVDRTYRLYAQIGGNLTVGPKALVSSIGLGYTTPRNPVDGTAVSVSGGYGGTHGGYGLYNGGDATYQAIIRPHGSVCAPEEPGGRGSNGAGGGAIRLDVSGAFRLDGLLCANSRTNSYYSGAGGSVYVRAGTLAGDGSVTADSVQTSGNYSSGSGGRIALVLTANDADFSSFDPLVRCSARSIGPATTRIGGAGTVYAETPADVPNCGWLIVRGSDNTPSPLASSGASPHDSAAATTSFAFSRITVTNRAFVVIDADCTLDMSATIFRTEFAGANTNGIALVGGRWIPPSGGVVTNCLVRAEAGTVDAPTVTFAAGAQLLMEESGEGLSFTGDVAFDAGSFGMVNLPLAIAGDLTVGGLLSRSGPATVPSPLTLAVTGDMTVSQTGCIDLNDRGYSSYPSDQVHDGSCSSHGGRGGTSSVGNVPNKLLPYGSILEPATGGSQGYLCPGGGILRLTVGGRLTNDGIIRANCKEVNYYPASGGSVNIRAGSLYGTGVISANGGSCAANYSGYATSGGGRTAVRARSIS